MSTQATEQPAPDLPVNSDDDTNETEQVELKPVLSLRPTQVAVGYHAAREKANRVAAKKPKKQAKYFRTHPVPVVVAPDGGLYIIDHHHLCVAALQLGVNDVYVTVRADWSGSASADEFWRRMNDAKYVWLYDSAGNPIPLEEFPALLPKDVTGLKDNPHRSLAAIVRRSGGFEKVWTPFSEFPWANFFRRHIEIPGDVIKPEHVDTAMRLAMSEQSAGLPGRKAGAEQGAGAPAADARPAPAACPAVVPPAAAVDAAA